MCTGRHEPFSPRLAQFDCWMTHCSTGKELSTHPLSARVRHGCRSAGVPTRAASPCATLADVDRPRVAVQRCAAASACRNICFTEDFPST